MESARHKRRCNADFNLIWDNLKSVLQNKYSKCIIATVSRGLSVSFKLLLILVFFLALSSCGSNPERIAATFLCLLEEGDTEKALYFSCDDFENAQALIESLERICGASSFHVRSTDTNGPKAVSLVVFSIEGVGETEYPIVLRKESGSWKVSLEQTWLNLTEKQSIPSSSK